MKLMKPFIVVLVLIVIAAAGILYIRACGDLLGTKSGGNTAVVTPDTTVVTPIITSPPTPIPTSSPTSTPAPTPTPAYNKCLNPQQAADCGPCKFNGVGTPCTLKCFVEGQPVVTVDCFLNQSDQCANTCQ